MKKQKLTNKVKPVVSLPSIVDVPSVTPTEIPSVVKTPKFRRSGHLTEQTLMYSDSPKQLSIFDTLLPATRDKIISTGATADLVNQRGFGIKLNKGEYKLLLCLSKLIDEKSQTSNKEANDYYTGNVDPNTVAPKGSKYDVAKDLSLNAGLRTVTIAVTIYELAKGWKGGDTPSGKTIDDVLKILMPLANDANKRALLKYTRTTVDVKTGVKTVDEVEVFQQLIDIWMHDRKVFSKEDIQLSHDRQHIIYMNPIFRDQIESKYVDYPGDIIKRMTHAYGSPNISEVAYKMIDLLAHARANKMDKYEIYLDKLYWKLAEDWMRDSKRGRGYIKKYVDKAIETAIGVGLLQRFELTLGATTMPKYIFYINRKWL